MALHVFSGQCEHGKCGIKTHIIDDYDNQLRVGDIVVTTHRDEFGVNCDYSLTVVVDDRPNLDGSTEKGKPFVMGLAKIDWPADKDWFIMRVKKFEDVLEGEKWPNFGFNFRAIDED